MKFRFVGINHYISRGDLRGEAKAFFPPLDPVKHALIAYSNAYDQFEDTYGPTDIAGWFRFDIVHTNDVKLWAAGTWVEPAYRSKGLAYELWSRAIDRFEPDRVTVRTISNEGRSLAGKIVAEHAGISFEVTT